MNGKAPASVAAYFADTPEPMRSALERLRAQVKAAAPDAEETITYAMPGFRLAGRVLVSYAAFKNHCSLFPMSMAVFRELGEEVAPYRTSKGTLQFTPDKPMPAALVRKIIKTRIKENAARIAAKKAKKRAKRTVAKA